MADESMIRNLAAQAEAIWPQEKPLFERYALPVDAYVLDAGRGTGEISLRLAQAFPHARVLGVDIIEEQMEFARRRSSAHGKRLRFENRSIFELGLADRTFDLVVCRHVLQTIPYVERAVAELARVTRRGGWIHLLVEDHLMIHFEARRLDPDDFWSEGPRCFSRSVGADLRAGRRLYGILQRQGLVDITVDYIVVDPLRVPRTTFAEIWGAWRDGYAEAFGANTPFSSEKYRAHFDDMIATIQDPFGYGVWHIPVLAARVP